jgi:hypothetical protein
MEQARELDTFQSLKDSVKQFGINCSVAQASLSTLGTMLQEHAEQCSKMEEMDITEAMILD